VAALEAAGIEYMVTGSVASSLQYLEEWASRLGVVDLLQRLNAEAEPI
jgi:hypothetical protein